MKWFSRRYLLAVALTAALGSALGAAGVLFAQSRTEIPTHIQIVASGDHPIQVDVTSLDFGTVEAGNSATRTFHITNPSTTTPAEVGFTIEGSPPPSTNFSWKMNGTPVGTMVIAPNTTVTVDFTVAPNLSTPVGDYNFTIVLLSRDAP